MQPWRPRLLSSGEFERVLWEGDELSPAMRAEHVYREGKCEARSVCESWVTEFPPGSGRGRLHRWHSRSPGIIPIPTAPLLWRFFYIHICLFWEHAPGEELAVNARKGSPFSHLNLKFPVIKRSHGNGGKLSPFLSAAEPCPTSTHNTGMGTPPAALLNMLCFPQTPLFGCDVSRVLCASRLVGAARAPGLGRLGEQGGLTLEWSLAAWKESTRQSSGHSKAESFLLCFSWKPEKGALGFWRGCLD